MVPYTMMAIIIMAMVMATMVMATMVMATMVMATIGAHLPGSKSLEQPLELHQQSTILQNNLPPKFVSAVHQGISSCLGPNKILLLGLRKRLVYISQDWICSAGATTLTCTLNLPSPSF